MLPELGKPALAPSTHMNGTLTHDLRRTPRDERRGAARRFALLAFIAVATTTTAAQSTAPGDPPALEFAGLEARLESLRDKSNVPGMVAGIALGNEVVWTKAFGYADLTTRAPVAFDLGKDEDVARSPFAREFLSTIGL